MADSEQHAILIVDDDQISREVMAMTLEMHGYAVASVEDGSAAVAFMQAAQEEPGAPSDRMRPDLVLMDSLMPGLSGVELIAALRQAGAGRVVAISASDPGEAIRSATDGFLLKPVSPEAVAALFFASEKTADTAEANTTPATPAETHEPAVDPVTLAKFRAMMPASAVREIYAATAADMKSRLITLESAIHQRDATELSRIAHSIKGSCAMVGMTQGRNAAARLETSGLTGTLEADLAQLHFALAALEVMLASDFPA